MTIEKLLQCSADQLEAMSDVELQKYFEPYLKFTRPELVEKPEAKEHRRQSFNEEDYQKKLKRDKARAMAKQLGIDLKF
jgi:hypothetical protein